MIKNKKNIYIAMSLVILTALATSLPAFAATNTFSKRNSGMHNKGMARKPGIQGTVASINGNTITVTGKQGFGTTTTTTYTVDATNAKITKNNTAGSISSIIVGDTIMVQGTVTGTNVVATTIREGIMNNSMRPVVLGTVASINGNTITVTGKQGFGTTTTTTYTVDATNAKITKNNTAGSISSIIVGDTIMVQGTVTGTNVVATTIRDGIAQGINKNGQENRNSPLVSAGNGLPIVAGTVTSVSGSTFVITNKSNVTYTVDATNAKITQGANSITVSNITTGDMVVVQGTVNGNSVIASSVNDQKITSTTGGTTETAKKGFFSRIGSFFGSMFGF